MAAPQSPEPRCPLNGMGQCFGDHDPQTLPGSDDSFLGRDGGEVASCHKISSRTLGTERLRERRLLLLR